MRDAWQYHELQSEFRTRFVSELRRELEAVLIYGPAEASHTPERSSVISLMLVSWYPGAIEGRAVRIAREIDAKYRTTTKLVILTPDRLLDTPWDADDAVMLTLQKGEPLHNETTVRAYRSELRQARQPS